MGMYSYFLDEDLQVKDWNGLVSFFKWWDKYIKKDDNMGIEFMSSDKMLNFKDKTITFTDWSEIKLISYWYDIYLIFFKLVASYIEGEVNWEFENKDEAGWINFSEGKCEVTTGQMNYQDFKPEDSIREKLDDEVKKRFILTDL